MIPQMTFIYKIEELILTYTKYWGKEGMEL